MFSKRVVELHQRIRFTCSALPKNKVSFGRAKSTFLVNHQIQPCPSFCGARYASTSSVVPTVITKAFEASSSSAGETVQSSSIESLIESIGPIPEAPNLPGPKVLEILSNGEPSLSSLGLGGYSPSGILQHLLEFVHVSTDLSWGWTIILVAALIRSLCFKLVVRQRQESAKLSATMPQMQFLQQKLLEARQQNDVVEASRYALEFAEFRNKSPSLFDSLKFGLIQGAILLSFTQALRQMCTLPVESLQTGGFYSVVDLTMTDPTYVLPFVNGLLFYLHLVTGKEVHSMFPGKNPYLIQGGILGISGVLFLISMNFQGAIVLYWISSQCVTVLQHKFLSNPKVKKYYNLENKGNAQIAEMMELANKSKPSSVNKLGFYARFKEGQANARLADEVKRRTQIDSQAFERAGREPIRKTYKYDVTKLKNK